MQTYLKNCYIVTMGADETVYDGGGVLIEGENIVAVGRIDPKLVKPDAEVIDLQGKYVLPGFVNTHVHTSQQISRGEIPICRQLHPKDGARPRYHTFVHIAIATFASAGNVQKTRQLRNKKRFGILFTSGT